MGIKKLYSKKLLLAFKTWVQIGHLCIILMVTYCCKGQVNYTNFNVTTLSQDNGLSQGSNYFSYEDSNGFMWITGNDALNRYDGKMVKVYNLDKYFKNCPNLQQGYGIVEDDSTNLYIGSTRGLYIYHRKKDKFTLQANNSDTIDKEAMPFAFSDNKVWYYNKKYEITTYDISNHKVEVIASLPLPPLKSIHVYDLVGNNLYFKWPFIDNEKNTWIVAQNRLFNINSKTHVVSEIAIPLLQASNTIIYSFAYDALQNQILFGTDKAFCIYNITTKELKTIATVNNVSLNKISSICCNKDVIAGCGIKGLVILERNLKNAYYLEGDNKNFFFKYYGIRFDKADRLWLCNDGIGQNIYDFSNPLLAKLPNNSEAFKALENRGVTTFGEYKNGDIAIQYNFVVDKDKTKLAIGKNLKMTIIRTATDHFSGGIWCAIYNNSKVEIFFKETNKEPVLKYTFDAKLGYLQDFKVIDEGRILAVFSTGMYWLQKGNIEEVKEIPNNNLFTISPISNNRCALSFLNNDMWIMQYDNANSITFLNKILPGKQSFYLQEDISKKQYWVGTNNGIVLTDEGFNIIKEFNANNGLAGTYIYGLLLDDEGNAWCSHQRGISSINTKSFQIINYDKKDGLQDWDFNNRAFYKATDGTLYFGGVNGLNYFKPPLKPSNAYKPEVYIDEIIVNDNPFFKDTNANYVQNLSLKYNENNITINAILKNIYNTSDEKLIYRVLETDSKWKEISNNAIVFNSLSSGSYTLELGYYDKFLNKEIIQKKLFITVATPFYKSKWFLVFCLLFLPLLFVYFWQRRQNKITKQKINETQKLNEQASLKQQAFAALLNPHFIFNSLNSIQHFINKQDRVSANKYLSNFASLIRRNFEDAQKQFLPLETEIENLRLYLQLEQMRFCDKIQYSINVDNNVEIDDWMLPTLMLQPFLENALMHGLMPLQSNGQVHITFAQNQNQLNICIADNGIGIKKSTALYQNKKHNSKGMQLIKERLEILSKVTNSNIELVITNNTLNALNPGTKVTICYPLSVYDTYMRINNL